MNAPASRILRNNRVSPRSAQRAKQHYDRDHSLGVSGRTSHGNYAVPAGRSANALPNPDTASRQRMKNLSARNRIENFGVAGAGGDADVMSRTQYDRAYTLLYNRLAQNAYKQPKGKAPHWSKCC